MIFTETPLRGAYTIELEQRGDARGFFARAWCRQEFEAHGLESHVEQCNVSFNERKGTLRGMHFQRPPHGEVKLIRCTRGAIWDAIVDLRPDSATYKHWHGVELTSENRLMLYVPEGFAHGYQTLVDETETFYQVSAAYAPHSEGGARWNDPTFGIEWPEDSSRTISDKDLAWPDFTSSPFGRER